MIRLLLSLVMGVVVYSFKLLGLSILTTLIIQVCGGVILYVWLAWIFKLECFSYLLNTLKDLFSQGQEES
jgi:teichuronic acid exporter